jgi:type II secretory pathway pseudopilin PulG
MAATHLTRSLRRYRSHSTRPNNQGITLVECLVAIAAIALTTAMVTPPLFIAAATRQQNQRAEQALQLAQAEVDRIRTLVEQGNHYPNKLPNFISGATDLQATPPPTPSALLKSVNSSCNTYTGQQLSVSEGLQIDINGDCQVDYMMQLFRTDGFPLPSREDPANGGTGRPGEFVLGVRVYGKPAIEHQRRGNALGTDPVSLRFTSGEGNQQTRPLAVLYTPILWSDRDFSACQFFANNTCP